MGSTGQAGGQGPRVRGEENIFIEIKTKVRSSPLVASVKPYQQRLLKISLFLITFFIRISHERVENDSVTYKISSIFVHSFFFIRIYFISILRLKLVKFLRILQGQF